MHCPISSPLPTHPSTTKPDTSVLWPFPLSRGELFDLEVSGLWLSRAIVDQEIRDSDKQLPACPIWIPPGSGDRHQSVQRRVRAVLLESRVLPGCIAQSLRPKKRKARFSKKRACTPLYQTCLSISSGIQVDRSPQNSRPSAGRYICPSQHRQGHRPAGSGSSNSFSRQNAR